MKTAKVTLHCILPENVSEAEFIEFLNYEYRGASITSEVTKKMDIAEADLVDDMEVEFKEFE